MDPLHITEFAGPRYFDKLRSLNEAGQNSDAQQPAEPIEGTSQTQTSLLTLRNRDRRPLLQRLRRRDDNVRPSDQKRRTLGHDLIALRNRRQPSFSFASVRSKIKSRHEVSSKNVHDDGNMYEKEPTRLLNLLLELPPELQLQIIAPLPVPTILNLRLVSKSFHDLVTQNESPIAIYHLVHSIPAYALRLYPVPGSSQVAFHHLCGLWHRLHVAQKLTILISEHITKEIFLRDTEAKLLEFWPQLTRMCRRLMPLVFAMFHFFEKYRDFHLQHLEAHGVPLRLQPFTLNPIEKKVVDMYDDDLLLAVHQVFPLVLGSFSRQMRPPTYTFLLERLTKGRKDKPADEVYASILTIGGLRQVERFWKMEDYNTRRAAVDQWYESLTRDRAHALCRGFESPLRPSALGRKEVTLLANPTIAELASGVNSDRDGCNEWYCTNQNCVGKRQTTGEPIYNSSLAIGPPMKPLPPHQLELLHFDQQPWTSIWSQTAEAVILERKLVENPWEIKRNTQVLLELIKVDVNENVEEWAPGLSQAYRHTSGVKDPDDFGGPNEAGTIAHLDPVRESQDLHPPPMTAGANVVEQAQNIQTSTTSAQPPIAIESDVMEVSNYVQDTAAGTETEMSVATKSAERSENLQETNITKEKVVARRIEIEADFRHVHETTPNSGGMEAGMREPSIQGEFCDVDNKMREIPVEAGSRPKISHPVSSVSTNSGGEFIAMMAICYSYMITRIFTSALLAVQRLVGEPDIPEGMERVRWRCSCGNYMYDDFAEQQLGAAKRLERSLNHDYESGRTSAYGSRAIATSLTTLGKSFSRSIQSLRQVIGLSSEEPGLPQQEMQTSPSNERPDGGDSMPVDPLWLLLCLSEGVYATKLLQLKVCKYDSDQKLFSALRAEYISMHGRWLSFISFRTLKHIRFVQFEMYEGRPEGQLVDVRKSDDIPPFWDSDYRYIPAPAEVIPPVGENHLMHLFQHPLHAQSKRVCFDRFPKKRCDPLVCAGQPTQLGWGLHFVEGWSVKKIWLSGFIMSGAGSLAFGILWAVFEHSIQDAFAVAGYCLTFGTFSIGTQQAVLHLN